MFNNSTYLLNKIIKFRDDLNIHQNHYKSFPIISDKTCKDSKRKAHVHLE